MVDRRPGNAIIGNVIDVKQTKTVVKIPHIPQTRATEKSTDSEKESVRLWNLMRKTCLDNNLMETKEETEARLSLQ